MSDAFDIPELALKIIPIIIVIAKMLIEGRSPAEVTAQEAAAIALFNAMLAYLEVID